jgi:hypothetical protein
MCGRYAVTSAPEAIRALFGYREQANFPPRYNVAQTQPIAIVRLMDGKRQFALVRPGLLGAVAILGEPQKLYLADQGTRGVGYGEARFQRGDETATLPGSGRRLLRVGKRSGHASSRITYARNRASRSLSPACRKPGPALMARGWKPRPLSRRDPIAHWPTSMRGCR